MSPNNQSKEADSLPDDPEAESEFEKYDLPLAAAGRFSPYLLDHFSNTALGRGPGHSPHTDQWEEDIQREEPADPGRLASIIYHYGDKNEEGTQISRRPYDASAPFQLLRQLAAAAYNSDSFESRWMKTWERVEYALEALFYMDESVARLLGASYQEDSRFVGDTDNLFKILRAASLDHQIGSDRVRGTMITAIGHYQQFILRTADDWNYKAGFQELAGVLTELTLSSDRSLLFTGRNGMYCTFFIILNFLQNRDPFETLVEIVLRSAKAHAGQVNTNERLARFWGKEAGNLAGTLQVVLIKENRKDMENSDVVSTWFSRIGTVVSIIPIRSAITSIVTQIGTEAIQEIEEASAEEQTEAIKKAAGKIEELVIEIGQDVIRDTDEWRTYKDAITTGSREARTFFGLHF